VQPQMLHMQTFHRAGTPDTPSCSKAYLEAVYRDGAIPCHTKQLVRRAAFMRTLAGICEERKPSAVNRGAKVFQGQSSSSRR